MKENSMEQATGPFLTAGSRKLKDSDITFSDEIMETDGIRNPCGNGGEQ